MLAPDEFCFVPLQSRPERRFRRQSDVPAKTAVSDAMSADLRRRGFKFVGSTICYAFMQAVGLANDHLLSCYRRTEAGGAPERRALRPRR
ncbi:MAG TPA: DNA-3-methyladenine glycosylase I [Gemmatimonadaceae bacterium]|nr:DNA-3-methyladenine glycosylase I [Gemmatimonadaceae bacterium]